MKYMGSKARHAKDILGAITEAVGGLSGSSRYRNWVEPFVGGANMIDKVWGFERRIGNDINPYLIRMFQATQNGWVPPEKVSEDLYKDLQKNSAHFVDDEKAPLVGFVGIGCSYSGKWFGGYARGNANNGEPRNYCLESRKNLIDQIPKIKEVEFFCGEYSALEIPDNSIIYCDPPYANSTKYKNRFDHQHFWEWCDQIALKGNKIFVSEYTAPPNWVCIWERDVHSSLTKDTGGKKAVEKLFAPKDGELSTVWPKSALGNNAERTV